MKKSSKKRDSNIDKSISDFYKPAPKKFLIDSASENFTSNASLEKVNCVALVLGRLNQVSDAVKYQILTCRDYLPKKFQLPLELVCKWQKRQCSTNLLNTFDFLR